MKEQTVESVAILIKKLAEDNLSDAGEELINFAYNFAPSTELEFKSAFIKAGVAIAENLPNKEQKEQAFKKLHLEISVLVDEIVRFSSQKSSENVPLISHATTPTTAKTYHGNKKIVIECKNIVKIFNREKFKLGVIDFDFRLGEITGLVGLNSHGKTTLLKIIASQLEPDEGKITYGTPYMELNNKVEGKNINLRIGYLPQELPFEYGTVKSNLHLAASLAGIFGKINEREVQFVLYRLGLYKKKNTKIRLLSGGFKLRYALAKLLVTQPNVLILDEPLANLDFKAQSNLLSDLKALAQNKNNPISIIITSQHIEEVETVADNMMVLKNGQLVYAGKTNQVYSEKSDNLFEIRTKIEFAQLKRKFKDLEHKNIIEESFYTFIYTPEHITREVFLKYCHDHKIDLMLFNDMSGSVKRLILENAEV